VRRDPGDVRIVDQLDVSVELGSDFVREARLADTFGAGDGDEPNAIVKEEPQDVGELLLAPDERELAQLARV
jgi:hypothetical protein